MANEGSNQNVKRSSTWDSARPKPTIRSCLLLAVNLPLEVEYSRELGQCLEDKRIALEEEAKTVLPAVLELRHPGANNVQQYIDSLRDRIGPGKRVSGRGRGLASFGHWTEFSR